MNEPNRYTGKTEGTVLGSPHWEHPEGEWVKWDDYARLKAEVERLTKAGDAMAADLIGEFGSYNSVYDWNAAKEGKQP
jgi:hypothetical protein